MDSFIVSLLLKNIPADCRGDNRVVVCRVRQYGDTAEALLCLTGRIGICKDGQTVVRTLRGTICESISLVTQIDGLSAAAAREIERGCKFLRDINHVNRKTILQILRKKHQ